MIVGCTAPKTGLTAAQIGWADRYAAEHAASIGLFVDGDCVGGDETLNMIFRFYGVRTRARPGTLEKYRAYGPHDETMPPKYPTDRNPDIVADAKDGEMLCFVNGHTERLRSGSWATTRRSRCGWIVYPDGSSMRLAQWHQERNRHS